MLSKRVLPGDKEMIVKKGDVIDPKTFSLLVVKEPTQIISDDKIITINNATVEYVEVKENQIGILTPTTLVLIGIEKLEHGAKIRGVNAAQIRDPEVGVLRRH
ncbi:MAG: hypothetical protein ASUL_09519 [Candidatus Aramenus sulfurataquae]|uniref:Uncharacterized protein n=1 Tax=Candidatus Aramenus sulfurataquae TaxID=1326980 RepID=W7KV03_9CREN|nr:MAG: hypothetical protein ASUL_09519 [Candidatus Aramenus sulfurataquae]